MSIYTLAQRIHKETGKTDAELELYTFAAAMILADVSKATEAGDYFQQRMRAAFTKLQAQEAQR